MNQFAEHLFFSDEELQDEQAINNSRRLLRHHHDTVIQHLHALLWGVSPAIDDLRSFVAKTALTFLMVCVAICSDGMHRIE